MMMRSLTVLLVIILSACTHLNSNNEGLLQSYTAPVIEPSWIRNGDPIVFENKRWYPVDDTETLLDGEVFQVGEFKGTALFVEKIDARPFDRIYTKFAKAKFRYYERASND